MEGQEQAAGSLGPAEALKPGFAALLKLSYWLGPEHCTLPGLRPSLLQLDSHLENPLLQGCFPELPLLVSYLTVDLSLLCNQGCPQFLALLRNGFEAQEQKQNLQQESLWALVNPVLGSLSQQLLQGCSLLVQRE